MNSENPVDILDVLIAGIVIANKEELVTRDGHFSQEGNVEKTLEEIEINLGDN